MSVRELMKLNHLTQISFVLIPYPCELKHPNIQNEVIECFVLIPYPCELKHEDLRHDIAESFVLIPYPCELKPKI